MKPHVYRQDDLVRIVHPHVVTRVGYPFDLNTEAARIRREHRPEIQALLRSITGAVVDLPAPDDQTLVELSQKLAFFVGRYKGLGGKERRIYTEPQPDIANHTWRVERKRTTMTGTYYRPSSYTTYGEHEYSPGGLAHAHCHVLLTVYRTDWLGEPIEIEAANVVPFVAEAERETCAT